MRARGRDGWLAHVLTALSEVPLGVASVARCRVPYASTRQSASARKPVRHQNRRGDFAKALTPFRPRPDSRHNSLPAERPRIERRYMPIPRPAFGDPTTGPVAIDAKSRARAARRISA